jgi:hypothetical protein
MASKQPKKPELQQYTPPDVLSSLNKFSSQASAFPGMQDTLTQSALRSLQAKESLFPGYTGTLGQAWQLAKSRSEGLVDAETAKRVSQMAAQSGFSSGAPAGSEQMGLQAARNYGTTAQQLQDSGLQLGGALRQETNAMMPLQAINLAFSPAQLRSEEVSVGQYNNSIANQQKMINYQYDQQYGGNALPGILGGVGGGLLGAGAGYAMSGGNPAGALMGGGLGSSLGGGVGGAFGGAQGQQFGGIFSGLGGSMAGIGALDQFGSGKSSWGSGWGNWRTP